MVKFLGDNPATTNIKDKNLLVLQEGGKDYIASWAVLLDNLKTDLIRPILKVQIGKIIINMDNSKRDVRHWNDGVFEYILCDGGAIDTVKHPELITIYGSNLPNFQNATIRHIPAGNSRTLGDYQADALQNITASWSHAWDSYLDSGSGAVITHVGSGHIADGNKTWVMGGATFDASRVARTADETRMQNVAVQFYVIAKVMI